MDFIQRLNDGGFLRLLEASTEEVKEPKCVDPTLVAASEARYK